MPILECVFEREVFVQLLSMLKRFQLADQNGDDPHASDRLLLTYSCLQFSRAISRLP